MSNRKCVGVLYFKRHHSVFVVLKYFCHSI